MVDAQNGKGSVELRRYPKSHPFAQLQGSDNIISFTTARYFKQPLIVRGPGAGADVMVVVVWRAGVLLPYGPYPKQLGAGQGAR